MEQDDFTGLAKLVSLHNNCTLHIMQHTVMVKGVKAYAYMVIESFLRMVRMKWELETNLLSVCIVLGRITQCRHQTACEHRVRSTVALQITVLTPRSAKWTTKTI